MSTTPVRPLANARAEAHFVASGLSDALRPAVSQEAHYLLNVGAAPRYSDAVRTACQYALRGEFTSPLATALAAEAVTS